VYVTAPPGDSRLFVVDRLGRVDIVKRGRRLRRPFVDLRKLVQLEDPGLERDHGGLLSLAFAPDYATSRRFYVWYTNRDGQIHVDELRASRANPDVALPGSRRTVLTVERRSRLDLGGQVQFGPDGFLYVGFGFGPNWSESQDLSSLRGKLLRIDPRPTGSGAYAIPGDNPFVSTPGARPEIYASGLRVPWRFSFDRRTGDLVLPDVGEDLFEEVNFVPAGQAAGANFGWPMFEGREHRSGAVSGDVVFPSLVRRHGPDVCAIIGGPVVRDRSVRRLYGRVLYADLCTGEMRSARLRSPRARGDRSEGRRVHPVSFGEDARGRVYVIDVFGPVYRIVPR
jgi:glucose/arabinose dehydrogenase